MSNKQLKSNDRKWSRRKWLPVLAGSLILPFAGWSREPETTDTEAPDEKDFVTLLKQDGTVVRVPRQTVAKAPVVRKKMSNKSLLGWLKAGKAK